MPALLSFIALVFAVMLAGFLPPVVSIFFFAFAAAVAFCAARSAEAESVKPRTPAEEMLRALGYPIGKREERRD